MERHVEVGETHILHQANTANLYQYNRYITNDRSNPSLNNFPTNNSLSLDKTTFIILDMSHFLLTTRCANLSKESKKNISPCFFVFLNKLYIFLILQLFHFLVPCMGCIWWINYLQFPILEIQFDQMGNICWF